MVPKSKPRTKTRPEPPRVLRRFGQVEIVDFFPWLKQVETVFLSVNRGSKVKLNGNVAEVLQQLYGITQDRKKCTLSDCKYML